MADAIARKGHTTAPAGDETCPQAVSISTMLAMIKVCRCCKEAWNLLTPQIENTRSRSVHFHPGRPTLPSRSCKRILQVRPPPDGQTKSCTLSRRSELHGSVTTSVSIKGACGKHHRCTLSIRPA
ncbi:hypothetical protein BU24DRAFT_173028 [Aaosphaeria arxii CBS 175.79]|uniref:Uncharacterized protein n=1 Tax=Aaosphaeria arxii CBS 175.79 TaxID=1450172 RepID=A0A6A5X5P2_9PLEO|nr:uncharacterized protein BU24DRAFT_173028 [Aaosphaeria arxii CBS 175.79]KAF2008269.1 hypothetical protein BU24DRAFT_173028 [Aaosphaeria arxii CBS 175.79]